jgi:hypothetical protein
VLWNSKNLTKPPDKTRYSGTVRISLKHQIKPDRVPGFFWCFSEILTVPEYLVLSVVLVRFLLFQNTWFYLKTRYSGTVRISLKQQIKPGILEQ